MREVAKQSGRAVSSLQFTLRELLRDFIRVRELGEPIVKRLRDRAACSLCYNAVRLSRARAAPIGFGPKE